MMRKTDAIFILAMVMTICLSMGELSASARRHYTIMAMGDSITQGAGKCHSYIYPLWRKLENEGYDFEFIGPRTKTYDVGPIQHCGFGGKTVEYLASKIDSLYRKYPADVILLHAGHNHFVEDDPVPGMIESYRFLIDEVLGIKPDAVIFVAQVIPSGKLPKYSYIPDLNLAIKKMVRSYHSKNVVLVNVAKGFDWTTQTADDFVHPNESGAEHMAAAWNRSICRHLKK